MFVVVWCVMFQLLGCCLGCYFSVVRVSFGVFCVVVRVFLGCYVSVVRCCL